MKKNILSAFIAMLSVAGASCALIKTRPVSYPSGLVFPLAEEAFLPIQGRLVSPIRERKGCLFFATEDGLIWCVDGIKRRALWKFKTAAEILASPSLGKDYIYVRDRGNVFYCLDPEGRLLWKKLMEESILTPVMEASGRVFFGTGKGCLWSFDLKGEDARCFKAGGPVTGGPLVLGTEIVFGAEDGRVYFTDLRGREMGTFQAAGKILPPIVSDGKLIYFNTDTGFFYGLSIARKRPRWKVKLGGLVLTDPVRLGKRLFALGSNSVLYGFKAKSGEVLWWANIPSRRSFPLSVVGDKVVVAALSSNLSAFKAATGKKAGEFIAGPDIRSNALWIDPFLVIAVSESRSNEGKLLFLRKDVRVDLSAKKKSPQPAGSEIVFSASASGFYKPRYEFYIKNGDKREVTQKESGSNDWSWYAEKEGNYVIGVRVTDEKESREAELSYVIEREAEKKAASLKNKETNE